MEIKSLLDYVFQYGIGTLCVVYMIYFQNTTMKEMLTTLSGINARLSVIEDKLEKDNASRTNIS